MADFLGHPVSEFPAGTRTAIDAAAIAVLVNDNAFSDGTDNSITPYGAFDRASSMKRILDEVGQTGFIEGS